MLRILPQLKAANQIGKLLHNRVVQLLHLTQSMMAGLSRARWWLIVIELSASSDVEGWEKFTGRMILNSDSP
jgi:hypothetical protein